jgi:hypothetical protein
MVPAMLLCPRACLVGFACALVACQPDARAPSTAAAPRELPALLVSTAAPPANVASADAVLRGPLAAAARDCYRQSVARDATAEGSIALTLGLDATGAVNSVDMHPRGIDPIAVECIRHAASTQLFSPPSALPATVSTTYDFPRPGTDYAVLVQRGVAPLAACAQGAGGAHGQLVLLVNITPDGKVRAIDVRSYEGLARDVAACGARAVGKVTFIAQPDERAALVTIDFES